MFRKLLVANRGEIACRVMTTAKRLGIVTVAVFSDSDAHARHVAIADEAWPIGPAPARQSYLSVERILDAARKSGAEAIHPGYGFLSENADFAAACAAAGIVFVGPPADAIRAMGSKAEAKALMARADVPLVPGYHGAAQDLPTLAAEAGRIGYPVLLKASAGGGGKGMRVVERESDLEAALGGAKRESLAAFGDERVLIEKYLTRPRHIEIQIFADTHGNIVSLFERDCSIQRRHQKVVEEAPAPGMDPDRRRTMGAVACAAARAVGYVGAGTVEFIAEGDAFFFMEMNTRLQVEHPVTEMITGLDLVEWQLRVAAGERLPRLEDQLRIDGHAIEMRVYAEDPARDFMPSIGTLAHLRQPETDAHVRIDTGVRQGDAISSHYDPMIAKLIAWGEDRATAVRRLSRALDAYEVVGVRTNLDLLRAIAVHPEFASGALDTAFIARNADALMPQGPVILAEPDRSIVLATAALAVLEDAQPARSAGMSDPWALADAWRLNGDGYQDIVLQPGVEATATLRLHPLRGGAARIDLPDRSVLAEADADERGSLLRLDGVAHRLSVVRGDGGLTVILRGRNHPVRIVDRLAPPPAESVGADRLTAPIPARVARVLVKPGDVVAKGAPLLVLEAMKMEMTLTAPMAGTIAAVPHAVDEMVREGADLVTFAAAPDSG